MLGRFDPHRESSLKPLKSAIPEDPADDITSQERGMETERRQFELGIPDTPGRSRRPDEPSRLEDLLRSDQQAVEPQADIDAPSDERLRSGPSSLEWNGGSFGRDGRTIDVDERI